MIDVIVVGGGHAGCEAALATARMGLQTVLCTLDKNWIASMPCNPSVGGPAKGIVVREIDALGGQMGKNADATALQFKMLNTTKGPGVRSLRVQSDKIAYKKKMQETLANQENLEVRECMAEEVLVEDNKVRGIRLEDGSVLECRALILTTGTYMASLVMVSSHVTEEGPDKQKTTKNLSASLRNLGIRTFRLKTGTPARIKTNSIDFSKAQYEPGTNDDVSFSYETTEVLPLDKQVPCYLIYTTPETHEIIRANLNKSSMYSGVVKGVGPRYCPSIEDKLVRFADKERHQLFLEPESLSMDTTYVQGFSTSMPYDVQDRMLRSLPGFENCVIDKYAYAIEYDAIDPLQLKPSLELKSIEGLFCAGQINGTSGYEEAAGQGIMAGINAGAKLLGKEPLILRRDEAYIGVMIDDLVTKGTKEPYRLLTSRAEYRLLMRHDNADQRMTEYGHKYGLISDERYQKYLDKMAELEKGHQLVRETRVTVSDELTEYLKSLGYDDDGHGSVEELLKRPGVSMIRLAELMDLDISKDIAAQLDIEVKYDGYIAKARREANNLVKMEKIRIPESIDYAQMDQLSLEAKQKLQQVRPLTIGQASRISGVNPADIMVLSVYLKQYGQSLQD
ncbi:MAG: tRNA uridine-5-carboxymethylaminomethyl(34) synthesis enzyme MnmG [Erysipelotrichaceae bacterium]|nr:tRNA uridine-5-carboxymethylaminomethyl(34) synthesis enzyme MnmG [Erysipelotrichaceae bacterium]